MRRWLWIALSMVLLVVIVLGALLALTAANIIPPSGMTDAVFPVLVNQLKPPECDGITLNNLVINANGGNRNDLILGTAGNDNLSGGPGNDCIVGGDGDDILNGGQGNDILLGGGGNDDLDGGPGTDICHGGPGADTFNRCETIFDP